MSFFRHKLDASTNKEQNGDYQERPYCLTIAICCSVADFDHGKYPDTKNICSLWPVHTGRESFSWNSSRIKFITTIRFNLNSETIHNFFIEQKWLENRLRRTIETIPVTQYEHNEIDVSMVTNRWKMVHGVCWSTRRIEILGEKFEEDNAPILTRLKLDQCLSKVVEF